MPGDYLEIANSATLWFAAAICVGIVFIQAILFTRAALKSGKNMGLTDEQLKTAFRSGVISSIGPSVAILVGMIALIAAMGGPIAWMRLSFIGSVMYELMAAEFGATAMGVSLSQGMDAVAYANAVWTMTIGASGWLLITGLFTDKLELVRLKLAGGREELLPVISAGAMLGAFGRLVADNALKLDERAIAVIFGGVAMGLILNFADKKNIQWLREWSLGISMFVGMIAAILVYVARGGGG